ncbi:MULTISPECIES: glycosyltransferase [Methylobacterium]|jgi:hypothetical protein|uniref:Glycosyltransferase n=1 Tax=Methylobacterium longum TaxID=767694 RepID=A0ABT8AI05_9HYPH|nr:MULTISPECIES: glycosyltransferase [Methylobacterium]MCJ2100473.1 glycosyltransferase [Methylobacterium sp. E-046]MDN3569454.1 glycosyltransferase [Methylobacterium longum]GJE10671.1 hypothetical protein FOHLNKBM_1708 [Methylobacterium longum]
MAYKTLIFSDYMAKMQAFQVTAFEMVKILADITDADVVTPPLVGGDSIYRTFTHTVMSGLSRRVRHARLPHTTKVRIEKNYDLFIFVGSTIESVIELNNFHGWKNHTGLKVAYIIEIWANRLKKEKKYIDILAQFDYVFTLHSNTAPVLQDAIGVHCEFLPTAVNALEAAPRISAPDRTIDILSIGRRSEDVHLRFLEMARSENIFYEYDTVRISEARVFDWEQHRFLMFSKIKRAKYFVCFDHLRAGGHKFTESQGEQIVPPRIFEGIACGSTIIGSPPQCPEFNDIFPWPDAVVSLPSDSEDVPDFLHDLDRRQEQLNAARSMGVIECLRLHDWSHRLAKILKVVGLEATPALLRRHDELNAYAQKFEHASKARALT